MNAEEVYNKVQSFKDVKSRNDFLKTLSDSLKIAYRKYSNSMRQKKYNEKPENKEKMNVKRKEHLQKLRKNDPEKYKEQNIKDVKAFRLREKIKEKVILKKIEDKKEGIDISNDVFKDILDAVPNLKLVNGELKKKRGRKIL
jgi:hypothetical protein